MKNNKIKQHIGNKPASMSNSLFQPVLKDNETATESRFGNRETGNDLILPEVLFITSYPPRVCGIATYSQDLITALNNKFSNSFSIRVCALETGDVSYDYPEEVKYTLDTSHSAPFLNLAKKLMRTIIFNSFLFSTNSVSIKIRNKHFYNYCTDLQNRQW